jgi:hypothetical protein
MDLTAFVARGGLDTANPLPDGSVKRSGRGTEVDPFRWRRVPSNWRDVHPGFADPAGILGPAVDTTLGGGRGCVRRP